MRSKIKIYPAKNKYYVVWKGITPGVYDNWGECKAQVDGQDGAKYKSFETKEEATKAFEKGYEHYLKTASSSKVGDVVRYLGDYGINVTIYDPWARPDDVRREYSLEVL